MLKIALLYKDKMANLFLNIYHIFKKESKRKIFKHVPYHLAALSELEEGGYSSGHTLQPHTAGCVQEETLVKCRVCCSACDFLSKSCLTIVTL